MNISDTLVDPSTCIQLCLPTVSMPTGACMYVCAYMHACSLKWEGGPSRIILEEIGQFQEVNNRSIPNILLDRDAGIL